MKETSAKQIAELLISEFLAKQRDWNTYKDTFYRELPELANRKELVAKAWQMAHRKWNEMQKLPQKPSLTPQIIESEKASVTRQPLTLPPSTLGQPLQINFNIGQPQNPNDQSAKQPPLPAETSATNLTPNKKLARSVDNFTTELLKTAISFKGIAKSTLKFKGATAAALLTGARDLILEMQSARIPQKLIEETLDDRYKTQFHALTTAIGTQVKDDGNMPKGWEKLKLPVISDKPLEKQVETRLQNVQISGQLAPASTPVSVGVSSVTAPVSVQQAHVSHLQWSPELRSAYRTAWDMTVQGLNSLISPEYYFSGSIPDDPAQAQSILKQVKLLFDAVNIARRISDQIPDVIAIAKRMGLEHLTAQIYG